MPASSRRPEVTIGDLQEVRGRVLEVERAPAVPVVVVHDLHPGGLEQLTPPLQVARAIDLEAGMSRSAGPVVCDRARAKCELLAVEEEQDPAADPKRDAVLPPCNGWQPEHVAVEALHGLALRALVVQHRFEHAEERWPGHGMRLPATGGAPVATPTTEPPIAIGAILLWAVSTTVAGVSINTIGVILIVVGVRGRVRGGAYLSSSRLSRSFALSATIAVGGRGRRREWRR